MIRDAVFAPVIVRPAAAPNATVNNRFKHYIKNYKTDGGVDGMALKHLINIAEAEKYRHS